MSDVNWWIKWKFSDYNSTRIIPCCEKEQRPDLPQYDLTEEEAKELERQRQNSLVTK